MDIFYPQWLLILTQKGRVHMMKEKWVSSIIAGVYIAMGAMVYLSISDKLVASLFFSVGILLVLNLHNRLFTRVCPLSAYNGSYKPSDLIISWIGNGIGTGIVALAIHFTRFETGILKRIEEIVIPKLEDSPISLLILGIFCALFVAFAVFVGGIRQKEGSFAQIFYVWLFITAFVFCGFEHIVADMYYLSVYALNYSVSITAIGKVLLWVTMGNIVGGTVVGYLLRKRENIK